MMPEDFTTEEKQALLEEVDQLCLVYGPSAVFACVLVWTELEQQMEEDEQ